MQCVLFAAADLSVEIETCKSTQTDATIACAETSHNGNGYYSSDEGWQSPDHSQYQQVSLLFVFYSFKEGFQGFLS